MGAKHNAHTVPGGAPSRVNGCIANARTHAASVSLEWNHDHRRRRRGKRFHSTQPHVLRMITLRGGGRAHPNVGIRWYITHNHTDERTRLTEHDVP